MEVIARIQLIVTFWLRCMIGHILGFCVGAGLGGYKTHIMVLKLMQKNKLTFRYKVSYLT